MDLEALCRQLVGGQLTGQRFRQGVWSLSRETGSESTIDLDRQRRCGFPEVVYAEGKSDECLPMRFTLCDHAINLCCARVFRRSRLTCCAGISPIPNIMR